MISGDTGQSIARWLLRRTLAALLLTLILTTLAQAQPRPMHFYVSAQGNDSWSGKQAKPNAKKTDGPFATLERARDAIRALKTPGSLPPGGVTVLLRGGVHTRKTTFELTAQDSGAPGAPVVYGAYAGEKPRVLGGSEVKDFQTLTDAAVLARLDPGARGKVLRADLKAQGVSDYGALVRRGFGAFGKPAGLELFLDGRAMTLARWPNTGWAKIAGVPGGAEGGRFSYEGDRPARWKDAEDVWLHGYWTHDWAESYEKVRSIDLERREIATEPPHGVYGYTAGKRFYALNVLEELDAPGEWYLDRKVGVLYFWPPSPLGAGKAAVVSVLEQPLVSMEDVSHVTLRGLTLEASRGVGIIVRDGTGCQIAGCTIRDVGTTAVQIQGGTKHRVVSCDITQTGEGGISLEGGDRKTLVPGGHEAVNNHIYAYSRWVNTYQPGVGVNGVGHRIAHNRIHDAPHNAIHLGGNDHVIEFNDIFRVCLETEDSGAFYMGRDFTTRGNILRHNYFHDLTLMEGLKGDFNVMAVYLDDCASGTTIVGNLFVRAGRAVMIGGGRDNMVENNLFVDCPTAVWVDARALGWAKKFAVPGGEWKMQEKLQAVNYKQPPYSTRYPGLATILDDEYGAPKGNKIIRNIARGGKWLELHDGLTDKVVTIENNWTDGGPGLVAPEKGDYRLKKDAPAARAIGFRPIPLDKIGLFKDEYRRALPPKTAEKP